MQGKHIYRSTIPIDAFTNQDERKQRQLAKIGLVNGGSDLETVSSEPGTLRLDGQYRGQLSDMLATELRELLDADGVEPLPLHGIGDQIAEDGYYSAENIDGGKVDPHTDKANSFRGELVRKGTRASHWRGQQTATMQVQNDFGSDQTASIALPATARKVRWFDGLTTEPATVTSTVSAEYGDVDFYDVEEPSFYSINNGGTNPTLIYELAYADEGDVDPGVWDTYGRTQTTTAGGNTVFQWQDVFSMDHEFRGDVVVNNGLLKLTLDEATQSITAEQWNNGTSSWDSVSLGSSTWQLFDVDITNVSMSRVEAQLTFEDSDGSLYALDMVLQRGRSQALWTRPENETNGTPSGLQTLLSPIATTSIFDPVAQTSLVPRSEVRL